jgi:hypothetical protein
MARGRSAPKHASLCRHRCGRSHTMNSHSRLEHGQNGLPLFFATRSTTGLWQSGQEIPGNPTGAVSRHAGYRAQPKNGPVRPCRSCIGAPCAGQGGAALVMMRPTQGAALAGRRTRGARDRPPRRRASSSEPRARVASQSRGWPPRLGASLRPLGRRRHPGGSAPDPAPLRPTHQWPAATPARAGRSAPRVVPPVRTD